jgi:hypothetical protein
MPLVNFVHSLYLCYSMRLTLATVRPLPWLLSLALAMGSCLVGATTRYVLLGKRAEWLASDMALPTYFLAWVLINSSDAVPLILTSRPGYVPPPTSPCIFRLSQVIDISFIYSSCSPLVFSFGAARWWWLGQLAMTVLEMVHKARTITGAVDLTVKVRAHSTLAPCDKSAWPLACWELTSSFACLALHTSRRSPNRSGWVRSSLAPYPVRSASIRAAHDTHNTIDSGASSPSSPRRQAARVASTG